MHRLEHILTKEGVFYKNTPQDIKFTIVLEEINEKASFTKEYLNNQGRILGFRAYHKLTGDPYYCSALISKKIGDPSIHVIIDKDNKPVEYATNLEDALTKAHNYLLKNIIEEATNINIPSDVYSNILDTTKIGKENFKQRKLKSKVNKANLNEQGPRIYLPEHDDCGPYDD